jgi:vacuolar-type H+-ATPase subunit C/Vma6
MKIHELKELLDEFLNRWTIENVQNLTLPEYVGLGNKDTFCQWVETKTRMLGSIKGMTSIKFGIYQRKDLTKKPKKL